MNRKGQVTVFVIMGIVILIIFSIFMFVKVMSSEKKIDTQASIEASSSEAEEMEGYIESCIQREARPLIKKLGEQGGTLEREYNNRHYESVKYRYLCVEGATNHDCVNVIVTRQEMEAELEESLKTELLKCIDLRIFTNQGYKVTKGTLSVDAAIAPEDVVITLNYPISLEQKKEKKEFERFISHVEIPLGKLYDASTQIVNFEAIQGFFDQKEWMDAYGAEIEVEKHKPYPDIVYSLKWEDLVLDEDYYFNFALQGKDTVNDHASITETKGNLGCCRNSYDTTCFANSLSGECSAKGGVFDPDLASCNCQGLSTFTETELCNGAPCRDCEGMSVGETRKHGESWCVYDGPVGDGFDYVGSRHYKHICIDGEEYTEECRDYREEICVEGFDAEYRTEAQCRPNRWKTCFSQDSQSACESLDKDCTWTDALVYEPTVSYGLQRTTKRCHPQVPPGFKHWQNQGGDVCSAASEWRYCDGYNCPDAWVDAIARLCYSLGDCGNFRNVADRITMGGYSNTDNNERSFLYLENGLISYGEDYNLNLPLAGYEQQALTGDEFDNPDNNPNDILNAGRQWFEDVSSWDPGAMTSDYATKGSSGVYVFGSGTCTIWDAPAGSTDCRLCEAYSMKDCTEYRCKSLGSRCIYYEEDGFGKCADSLGGVQDRSGPIIEFKEVITDGHQWKDADYMDRDAAEILPAARENSVIKFKVSTNEPANCMLVSPLEAFFPTLGIFAIPQTNTGDYVEEHVMSFTAQSLDELYEGFLGVANAGGMGDDINRLIEVMKLYGYMGNFVSDDAYVVDQIIQSAEKGENPVSIICEDASGNKGEFFVITTFQKGLYPDNTPPEIVNTSPETGSIVNENIVDFDVFVDEVAECRYDFNDKSFSQMQYEFNCPLSAYSAQPDGLYDCWTDLDLEPFPPYATNVVYIRCKDNPIDHDVYSVELVKRDSFDILEVSSYVLDRIELIPPNIIDVADGIVLKGSPKKIAVKDSSTLLRFHTYNDAECRYSNNEHDLFENMIVVNCVNKDEDRSICVQLLPSMVSETYYFKCHDINEPTSNINPSSYVFEITRYPEALSPEMSLFEKVLYFMFVE